MGLTRDIPKPLQIHEDTILATCSALITTAESTSPVGMLSLKATADAVISTGDIGDVNSTVQGDQVSSGGVATLNSRVIDRWTELPQTYYYAVSIAAYLHSSRGSTEADRKLALGAVLQHGDSSGGGDMAEYSTGQRARDRVFFTSARTTDMSNWDTALSSGEAFLVSPPGDYDLKGAKRYVRVQGRFGKNSVTTESSGDEQCRVGVIAAFYGGDELPEGLDTTSPWSTSTST